MTNFLIISPARCGSTALRVALNRMPGVSCHGEIFAPNRVLGLDLRNLHDVPKKPEDQLRLRNSDSVGFIDMIYSADVGAKGFKAVYNQLAQVHAATVLDYLVENKEIKVIFMWRNNLCKRYISEKKLVAEYGNRNSGLKEVVLNLDKGEMMNDFECQIAMERRYRKFFSGHDVFDIVFEEMFASGCVPGILDFLSIEKNNGQELQLPDEKADYSSGVSVVVENESELLAMC